MVRPPGWRSRPGSPQPHSVTRSQEAEGLGGGREDPPHLDKEISAAHPEYVKSFFSPGPNRNLSQTQHKNGRTHKEIERKAESVSFPKKGMLHSLTETSEDADA